MIWCKKLQLEETCTCSREVMLSLQAFRSFLDMNVYEDLKARVAERLVAPRALSLNFYSTRFLLAE